METLITLATGLALLVLLSPLLMLLFTAFVLVPLAHLQAGQPGLARASFACPFSRRHVTAAFVTAPGVVRPLDVASCSVFHDGRIRCQKGCLDLATSHEEPSPMVARFALISGGATHRETRAAAGSDAGRPAGGHAA